MEQQIYRQVDSIVGQPPPQHSGPIFDPSSQVRFRVDSGLLEPDADSDPFDGVGQPSSSSSSSSSQPRGTAVFAPGARRRVRTVGAGDSVLPGAKPKRVAKRSTTAKITMKQMKVMRMMGNEGSIGEDVEKLIYPELINRGGAATKKLIDDFHI